MVESSKTKVLQAQNTFLYISVPSFHDYKVKSPVQATFYGGIPGGYSHTLPIRVCAAQRGRDFEAPDLERGIHFRGVF